MAKLPPDVAAVASGFDRPALLRALANGAAPLGLLLSARQCELLIDYLALLVKWNSVYNLTAIREPAKMLSQHLLDCLAALPAFSKARNVLDVGAGAGLPGVVIAVWALEAAPAMRIALIDSVQKKTAFLTQVKAQLGLSNLTVHTGRVEELRTEQAFDAITSRAFAELKNFTESAGHLLAPDGCFIAMKGIFPEQEIAQLPAQWGVVKTQELQVPALDAQRHLVWMARR